jgi:ATP-dependent RNA helicase DeaD
MNSIPSFLDLGVSERQAEVLSALGYETPSPVQVEAIPPLLAGRDLLGQAQTGTGKTAAFALPILSRITLTERAPQALILAPTRELAIQVANAFKSYAKGLPGLEVTCIYGGQSYTPQLTALKRGAHIVVGTPGRVMDHLKRRTLSIQKIKTLVLDEADEMLRMGFIEDVEWVLSQMSHQHQTALFSATMPPAIAKVSQQFLSNPVHVQIRPKAENKLKIEQTYMLVPKQQKVEGLCRYLMLESFEGVIIFTATKTFSVELAEQLGAQGYSVAAMNGDMTQSVREQVIGRFKSGKLDIVVATEVAARGLDVSRTTHVINFDIPRSAESYTHRIGRTGRAGRSGKALLLVTPQERRPFQQIDQSIPSGMTRLAFPTAKQVREQRLGGWSDEMASRLSREHNQSDMAFYREHLAAFMDKHSCDPLDLAALILLSSEKERFGSLRDYGTVEFTHGGAGRPEGGRSRSRRSDKRRKSHTQSQHRSEFQAPRSSGYSPGERPILKKKKRKPKKQ